MLVRDTIRLVVVAAVAILFGCHSRPDPVALRWLSQNCTVGEHSDMEVQLRNEGTKAESTLISAFDGGPDGEVLDRLAAEASREYDEVATALHAGRTYGLSTGDVAAVRAVTREEHVRRARGAYERAYRASALAGLGVVALPRGLELLRRVSADPRSPDREIADVALRYAAQLPGSP